MVRVALKCPKKCKLCDTFFCLPPSSFPGKTWYLAIFVLQLFFFILRSPGSWWCLPKTEYIEKTPDFRHQKYHQSQFAINSPFCRNNVSQVRVPEPNLMFSWVQPYPHMRGRILAPFWHHCGPKNTIHAGSEGAQRGICTDLEDLRVAVARSYRILRRWKSCFSWKCSKVVKIWILRFSHLCDTIFHMPPPPSWPKSAYLRAPHLKLFFSAFFPRWISNIELWIAKRC